MSASGLTVPTELAPTAYSFEERVGLESQPIKMIVQIQTDKKYLFLFRIVTYNKWIELAIWWTKVSAKKGWQFSKKRLITPLFGMGWVLERKRNEGT